jgi:hypothetical protein
MYLAINIRRKSYETWRTLNCSSSKPVFSLHCLTQVSVPDLPLYMSARTNTERLHYQCFWFIVKMSLRCWNALKEETGLKKYVEDRWREKERSDHSRTHTHTQTHKHTHAVTHNMKPIHIKNLVWNKCRQPTCHPPGVEVNPYRCFKKGKYSNDHKFQALQRIIKKETAFHEVYISPPYPAGMCFFI